MVFSHERAEFKASYRGVENVHEVPDQIYYKCNVYNPLYASYRDWTTGCAQLGLGVERIHLRLIRFRLMDFTEVKY